MTSLVENQWNVFGNEKFSVNDSFVGGGCNCKFASSSYEDRDGFLHIEAKKTSKGYGSMNEIIASENFSPWQSHYTSPLVCSCLGLCKCAKTKELQSLFQDLSNVPKKEKNIPVEGHVLNRDEDSDFCSFRTSTPKTSPSGSSLTLPPVSGPLENKEDLGPNFKRLNTEMTLWKKWREAIGKFTKAQWFALFGVCYVNCVSNTSLSILSSFFSQEAITNHGVSEFVVGFIFGCYAIINTIFCPVFGKVVPKTGSKKMILTGLFVSSACSFCFSQLFRCTSTIPFVVGCFIIRGVQAMGCAAYYTGATVTIAQVWKDDMTFAMGLGEVFSGIGMITGPLLGGWLYLKGGFQFPFIMIGSVMFLGVIITYFAMTDVAAASTSEQFTTLLKIPNVAFTALFTCVMWAAMDFNMPLLSLHMNSLEGSNPVLVGIMFLIMAAAYTVCAPLVGIIAKTKVMERSFMICGGILVGFSFLLIGPSPIFYPIHFENPSIVSISLSMIVLGIGISAAVVPTFGDLNRSAVDGGMKDNISTYGLVGAVFNGMVFFGEFIGPVIGGALMGRLQDYRIVSSIFSAIVLFVVGVVCIYYLIDWWRNKATKTNTDAANDPEKSSQPATKLNESDEKTPLLPQAV